jgi:hypothetical protein
MSQVSNVPLSTFPTDPEALDIDPRDDMFRNAKSIGASFVSFQHFYT